MDQTDLALRRAAEIRRQVYTARPLPLVDIAYEHTYEVGDYGAIPGSGENALPAIRACIAAALGSSKPSRIRFREGRYDLYPEFEGPGHCVEIHHAQDLLLDGGGAELVIHNPLAGWLLLTNSQRVLVRDFEIDYQPLPFTQGLVTGIHPKLSAFDLQIDPGYSQFDEKHWSLLKSNMNWLDCASWGMLKDRNIPGRLKPGCPNAYFARRFEHRGDRTWRIFMAPAEALQFFEIGDRYVHQSRPECQEGTLVQIGACNGVTLMNILSYASPSWCYIGWGSSWLGFLNVNVRLKEGRWHTLDSDGINTGGGRIGPWIEGCHFEGGADDTFVSHGAPQHFTHQNSDRKLGLHKASPIPLHPGDTLLFYNPRDGMYLDRAVVEGLDHASGAAIFDRHLPRLSLGVHPAVDDFAFNLACANNGLVIRQNTVRNNRRWPVWVSTPNICGAIIEQNTIEGVDCAGINFYRDTGWDVPRQLIDDYADRPGLTAFATQTAPELGHVLVAHNILRECSFNSPDSAIQFTLPRMGFRISPWAALNDVVILENTIENWCGKHAIGLENVQNAWVQGNQFTNQGNRYPRQAESAIHLAQAQEITIAENSLIDDTEIPSVTCGENCQAIHYP